MRRRRRWILAVAAAAIVALSGSTVFAGTNQGGAGWRSLPRPTSGHRPGPDILYQKLAQAPQLQNRPGSGWHAAPLLVSGSAGYVAGEYLYQGYLFDDHGGAGTPDPNDPFTSSFLFAAKSGTLTYPTAKVYANNAADLVEFRVMPTPDATAIRVTLNSLINPARTAFTVAIGSSPAAVPWPDGAGVRSPAALFLTVHGDHAALTRADTVASLRPTPTVSVDTHRHQYDVRIPHAAWDPGARTVRFAAGVGLWDVSAGHYLQPGTNADATTPGGASPSGEALFDLAFRFHETAPDWSHMGRSFTLADGAVMEQADQHCFWRDCAQAAALQLGDASGFAAQVDFGTLQQHVTDLSQVPQTGSIDRIMASHFSLGQGVDPSAACGRFPVTCTGMLHGDLQPYNVYVPSKPMPADGWGLTLQLHASGGNYNEYMGSRNQSELGDRGQGSLVLTPLARDPDGDYTDATEADIFEAWADVAHRYRLDPTRSVVTGYSMGGGGTYKLMERWPDLFARGFAAAAVPYDSGFQGQWIRNMRNVPLLMWISLADEGSPVLYQREQLAALEAQGERFTMDEFVEGDHVTLATNDEYGPAATWLGNAQVKGDPAHITYAVDPLNDFPKVGDVADHAYWLSRLTLRSTKPPTMDTVDSLREQVTGGADPGATPPGPAGLVNAYSGGFGLADPRVVPPGSAPGLSVLLGGYHGPMPYLETTESWATTRRVPATDRLTLTATNLTDITVDIRGAHLTCAAKLDVHTDGPLTIHMPACNRSVRVGAGHTQRSI